MTKVKLDCGTICEVDFEDVKVGELVRSSFYDEDEYETFMITGTVVEVIK